MIDVVTLVYSLICVLYVTKLKRGHAVGFFVLATLVWPDFLRVAIAGIQMSPSRFIALTLILKYRNNNRKKGDKFSTLDKLVLAEYIWGVLALIIAGADEANIKENIGRGMNTALVYFAVRYTMRDKEDLKDMIHPLLLCGIIMGGAGIYEAVTAHSPYQKLVKYNKFVWMAKELEYRAGFLRAQASTSHPIYFGMAMFVLSGLLLSLRDIVKRTPNIQKKPLFWLAGLLGAIIGAFTTLSSGPILATVLLLIFNAVYFKTGIIKPIIRSILALMLGIEILSNRHFYHLVEYLTLDRATAYYRTRLMEVAVNQVHEYWLVGLGGIAPLHWGMLIDGRAHVDIVNNYVIVAVSGGLASLYMFVRIQLLCFKRAVSFYKTDEDLKIFGFGMASLLLSFMLGTLSVGVYSSILIFSYLVYGLIASPIDVKEN